MHVSAEAEDEDIMGGREKREGGGGGGKEEIEPDVDFLSGLVRA